MHNVYQKITNSRQFVLFNLKMYIVHSTQEKQLQNENIIEYIRIERENF